MKAQPGEKQPVTVTASGERLAPVPHGVTFRALTTHADHRGWLMEMFNPDWGWHPGPLVHAYAFTVRPGIVKGWGRHAKTEDRYCVLFGEAMVVLYDDRPDSPTRGLVSEIPFTERHRRLMNIPVGIWHAVANIGSTDFVGVNFKTRSFDHADPDKYTLPLATDQIPYRFPGR
jgi:dTDP-4-dehydrorhamnose 3,5-epimerase